MTEYEKKLAAASVCLRIAKHEGPCNGTPRPIANGLFCFNWPHDPYPDGITSDMERSVPRYDAQAEVVERGFAPKPLILNAVHKVGNYYHRLECGGACNALAGCAPEWQPDEIRAMSVRATEHPKKPIVLTSKKELCRDKTSAERKAEPIHSGVLMYFPDALAAVARLSKAGNDKHNPGEPLHWARDKSTDQMDCLARHTLTKDAIDPETGEAELVATAWRALAQLQLDEERRNAAKGIKSYSGIAP